MRITAPARVAALTALVAMTVALFPAGALPARNVGSTSTLASLESGILVALNKIRRSHGLVPLTISRGLTAAAVAHSKEMLARGYFAHASADGSAFWKRIQRYYPPARHASWSVGENLLWDGAAIDATEALDLWMASPQHRANILNATWRQVGIAAVYKPDAPGVFGGYSATVVATDFGVRG